MHRKVADEETLRIPQPWSWRRMKPDVIMWWAFLGSALGVLLGAAFSHAVGML